MDGDLDALEDGWRWIRMDVLVEEWITDLWAVGVGFYGRELTIFVQLVVVNLCRW
jgi:hypothetical protein